MDDQLTDQATDQNAAPTAQQTDDDIKVLDEMIASLEDDNAQIAQVIEDTQAKIASDTAPYIQELDGGVAELKDLEKQADAEENAGQIQDVQTQISEM